MFTDIELIEREAPDIQKFVGELADGHDEVQLKHFIIEMHGLTDYGRYRQACREVSSRFDGMKGSAMNYDRSKAYRDLYAHKAKKIRENPGADPEETELKARLLDTITRKHSIEMETNERLFRRQLKELRFFVDEAKKWGEKIEGRDRSQLIMEFWLAKVQRIIALNTVGGGNSIEGAVEMILSLPPEMQNPLFAQLDEMKYRAKMNDMQLQGAAVKTLEQPHNILTLNGKK